MFFHSVWKPMLAGAVGAAIMAATVIGSVWVILPKISTREVVVDHVVQHDVPFDNHVPQDKPFDNYVPHAKPFDVPVPAPKPVAEAAPPTMGPDSPYAAKTPDEKKFVDQAGVQDRRLITGASSRAGTAASCRSRTGRTSSPAHWDEAHRKSADDPDSAYRQRPVRRRSRHVRARSKDHKNCGTAPPCTMAKWSTPIARYKREASQRRRRRADNGRQSPTPTA